MITTSGKRLAECVFKEVDALVLEFGLSRLAFVTYTFPDQIRDLSEVQRRWHLASGYLSELFERQLVVIERHKSGAVHLHAAAVCSGDIRTGWNVYQPSALLRSYWAKLDTRQPENPLHRAKFGRIECVPVKASSLAMARYLAKYISKGFAQRLPEDKGKRFVRFVGYKHKVVLPDGEGGKEACMVSRRKTSVRFAAHNVGSVIRRLRIRAASAFLRVDDVSHLVEKYGKRWAWKLRDVFMRQNVVPMLAGLALPAEAVDKERVDQLCRDYLVLSQMRASGADVRFLYPRGDV